MRERPSVLLFEVPGLPVPKARARSTRRGQHYTPASTVDYEARVRIAFAGTYPGLRPFPKGVHLRLVIVALLPLPASAPKRVRKMLEDDNWAFLPMAERPDLDNLVKTVLDALNRVAWADDGQVAEITARKCRTVRAPRLTVCVAELVAPVTSGNPGSGAKDGPGGVTGRALAAAPYARFCARPEAAGAPAEAAVGADAACPPSALGPPSPRSPNTPTGNTRPFRYSLDMTAE